MSSSNTIWRFSMAAEVRLGRGCSRELPQIVSQLGRSKPLVVTDQVLVGLPIIGDILENLSKTFETAVFSGGKAEPEISVAEAAIEAGRCADVDCVIGIGGGSNLDVAKVAATVLAHGGEPRDYFGYDAIPGPVLPVIALPTTAGTGSEVSHSAVLTDTENGVKVSSLSRHLRPSSAVVDPCLTDSCPASVTGQSGIDALVHAIEAYTNRDYTEMVAVDPQARAYQGAFPLTGLFAEQAIRLVGENLAAATNAPTKAARDAMAEAAMLAGLAFSNSGVGIIHALEYPIGALTHCGHGEGNGLLLPHVMRYNINHRTDRFARVASLLGADTSGKTEKEAAEMAIAQVQKLQSQIGLKTQLRQFGLDRDSIPAVAAKAFEIKRLMSLNIRPPSQSDLESILESAF